MTARLLWVGVAAGLLAASGIARAQELVTPPSTPHVADPDAGPPPPEPSQPQPPPPGELCYPAPPPGQTHDGFYLRLQVGGGWMTARKGLNTFSAKAWEYGVSVGGILVPNLAVFGTLLFHDAPGPHGNPYGNYYTTTINGDLSSESIGAGFAYYFVPANVYVLAAGLATSAEVLSGDKRNLASSNRGLGFELMLGKEWWAGREWGLGMAAGVTGAWMTDTEDHSTTWSSFTYSLLFSATYN
ncbi:MAG TPA: hypothetical protein VMT03_10525 [Polyangia bacterium]|nr:hypothetical protein [Polyangia bacterium]